jgi:hypothetical protein
MHKMKHDFTADILDLCDTRRTMKKMSDPEGAKQHRVRQEKHESGKEDLDRRTMSDRRNQSEGITTDERPDITK